MQIKDEWASSALDTYNAGPEDEVAAMRAALSAVAPLIAAEVVDACARVADHMYSDAYTCLAGLAADIAREIRREVPKMLGESDENQG